MGRVGTAAYEDMRDRYGDVVIGVDFDANSVKEHQTAGRNVICGDATDTDFWERATARGKVNFRLVMLAMPEHSANLLVAKEITARKFEGIIAAVAKFDDEVEELKQTGAQAVYNHYAEAGYGFAEHAREMLGKSSSNMVDKSELKIED